MTSLQCESLLLEDVYLHTAVSADRDVAVAIDAGGDAQLFSLGTDGHVYNFVADPAADTGWRQADLGAPFAGRADVIAAARDASDTLFVCVAEHDAGNVYVASSAAGQGWTPWRRIAPGAPVSGPMAFYELELRQRPDGGLDFLLLHFLRDKVDPGFPYYYRIGRGSVTAASWSVPMITERMTGYPRQLPTMAVGSWCGAPSAFIYQPETRSLRGWQGLDAPVPPKFLVAKLPDAGDQMVRLSYQGGAVVGVGLTGGAPGLFRIDGTSGQAVRIASGPAAVDAAFVADPAGGYHVTLVTPQDSVAHVCVLADGAARSDFTPLAGRVRNVSGCLAPGAGPLFLATTEDHRLFRYLRGGGEEWLTEEVATQAGSGDDVVWYTSVVLPVDDTGASVLDVPLAVTSTEPTEVLLNGVPALLGPGRTRVVAVDGTGRLVIQQRTEESDNLWVPDLQVSVASAGSDAAEITLSPYADTRDRLYGLTGQELLDAHARDPARRVLPEDLRGEADAIAAQLSLTMSLGRPLRNPSFFQPVAEEDLGGLRPGQVRFTATGTQAPTFLPIDPGDLFEAIKDLFVTVVDAVLQPVIDRATGLVQSIYTRIQTPAGWLDILVDTLEFAFDALRTTFDRCRILLRDVLEWLGRLIDWAAIRAWQQRVKDLVADGVARLPARIASSGLQRDIAEMVQGWRRGADASFAAVREQLGMQTVRADARSLGYANFGSLFDFGQQSLSGPANWLLNKVLAALPGLQLVPVTTGPGWDQAIAWRQQVAAGIEGPVQQAIGNLTSFVAGLGATGLADATLNAILDTFQSLADAILGLLQDVATAGVEAVLALCSGGALTALLATPLQLPVIGSVLKIVGIDASTTVIDLLSLLMALPAHTVSSFFGSAAGLGEPPGICAQQYLIGAAGLVVYAVCAAFADTTFTQQKAGLAKVVAILTNILAIVLCIIGLANWDATEWEGRVGFILYALLQLGYIDLNRLGEQRELAELTPMWGLIMLMIAIVFVARAPATAATKVGAIAVTLPDIAHALDVPYVGRVKPVLVCEAEVCSDLLCYGGAALAGFVDYRDCLERNGCRARDACVRTPSAKTDPPDP